jgi:hypothetical protein
MYGSITTNTTPPNIPRQVPQTNNANEVANKSYATVARTTPSTFQPSAKFRVPFDECPSSPSKPSTSDPVVQVDSIAEDVQKERGYQIIGKVRAPTDELLKILAVGALRI